MIQMFYKREGGGGDVFTETNSNENRQLNSFELGTTLTYIRIIVYVNLIIFIVVLLNLLVLLVFVNHRIDK